jgi:hypothetical protein
MESCESKTGGSCRSTAMWKQAVHAGNRTDGRLLYHSYWCDEHAGIITAKRRLDHLPPPTMARLIAEQV